MIRKQHKKYNTPRKLFEKDRIDSENKLLQEFGLKNKREIWKAEYAIEKLRNQAKKLITASQDEQQVFISKLHSKGFISKDAKIDDILALTKEAIFGRRLQTVVFKKGIAKTAKEARQLIVHKHIKVGDEKVNIPSYSVDLSEENSISLIKKAKSSKKVESVEAPKEEAA